MVLFGFYLLMEIMGKVLFQSYWNTFSRAGIVELEEGEQIYIHLVLGAVYSTDAYKGVYFSGFLYEPSHGLKVAWSVHRTTGSSTPLKPVDFEVDINEGGHYNSTTHQFTAPVGGIYLIHINVAANQGQEITFGVYKNMLEYFNIHRTITNSSGVETLGRALLMELSRGDTLHVEASNAIYGDANKQNSFTGLLLFPRAN